MKILTHRIIAILGYILGVTFIMLIAYSNVEAAEVYPGPYKVTNIDVYDGDTFKADVKLWPGLTIRTGIRIAGIDTPEIRGKCLTEKLWAKKAKEELISLLVGFIHIYNVQNGKYAGRVVADVATDTAEVGFEMIESGLARKYTGKGARASWCD